MDPIKVRPFLFHVSFHHFLLKFSIEKYRFLLVVSLNLFLFVLLKISRLSYNSFFVCFFVGFKVPKSWISVHFYLLLSVSDIWRELLINFSHFLVVLVEYYYYLGYLLLLRSSIHTLWFCCCCWGLHGIGPSVDGPVPVASAMPMGWNAESLDGISLNPVGLYSGVGWINWSASVCFRHTCNREIVKSSRVKGKGFVCVTFSQPSGGSRAKNRLMRADGPFTGVIVTPSSGDVLWLPSMVINYERNVVSQVALVGVVYYIPFAITHPTTKDLDLVFAYWPIAYRHAKYQPMAHDDPLECHEQTANAKTKNQHVQEYEKTTIPFKYKWSKLTKFDSGRQPCGWPGVTNTNFSISWFNPSTELRIGFAYVGCGRGGINIGLALAVNIQMQKKSQGNSNNNEQQKKKQKSGSCPPPALTMNGAQCLRAHRMLSSTAASSTNTSNSMQSFSHHFANFHVSRLRYIQIIFGAHFDGIVLVVAFGLRCLVQLQHSVCGHLALRLQLMLHLQMMGHVPWGSHV